MLTWFSSILCAPNEPVNPNKEGTETVNTISIFDKICAISWMVDSLTKFPGPFKNLKENLGIMYSKNKDIFPKDFIKIIRKNKLIE